MFPLAVTLDIVQNTDGSWTFTITPQTLRSAMEMVYSQILEIGYIVDESVAQEKYEATISNLSFEFENGTTVSVDEIPVQITGNNVSTGISELIAGIDAYLHDGQLYVDSPIAETIRVYSVNGVLQYSFQKPAGKAIYRIDKVKGSVLIVTGSSGWVKKAIR